MLGLGIRFFPFLPHPFFSHTINISNHQTLILDIAAEEEEWCQKYGDISLHADTQHKAVLISSLFEKLSTPQNLPYLKQSTVKCLEKIVHCYPMRVMEWSGPEYLRTNYGAIRCGQDPILSMASADKGGALVVLGAAGDLCLKAF